ncbi:uncharacterized protein CPUR_08846 [Claviceps purpurea 20.1]|uniref:Uncharacterized protein n=1 Tax=Claviceps purpurea (strain 20.1) TaxID=1111077 RepID=M1VZG1_CLAP2|nr:uncharacterized protein CPUR_08846 [Claviceps purpurea 20.1]
MSRSSIVGVSVVWTGLSLATSFLSA